MSYGNLWAGGTKVPRTRLLMSLLRYNTNKEKKNGKKKKKTTKKSKGADGKLPRQTNTTLGIYSLFS